MCETTMQTFGGSAVLTVKIVGTFKTGTRSGRKRDLTTWARERNPVNFTLKLTKSIVDTTENLH